MRLHSHSGEQYPMAEAFEQEITTLYRAGYDYSLLPIRAVGAFHPKIAIFAGQKKASLLEGSHNLTVSGFGYNREMSNLIELTGKSQAPLN